MDTCMRARVRAWRDAPASVQRLLDGGPALRVAEDGAVELHEGADVRVGHPVVGCGRREVT